MRIDPVAGIFFCAQVAKHPALAEGGVRCSVSTATVVVDVAVTSAKLQVVPAPHTSCAWVTCELWICRGRWQKCKL